MTRAWNFGWLCQYWDTIIRLTETSEARKPLYCWLSSWWGDFSLTLLIPRQDSACSLRHHRNAKVRGILPGKGMLAKLLVSTWRRVSRCCCKTVLRLRSWITSTSSFSTAVRMLSTCFCRAAFLSSNSMLDFRSWRSSASRAEDTRPQTEHM